MSWLSPALGGLRGTCAALLLGVVAATAAPSQTVALAGADDPAFAEALTIWLEDREGPALSALSELARAENRAAQVLLGVIDKTPSLQGPWLAHLPRNERIALLRAPGGISGTSWLRAAAVDQDLAAAWLDLMEIDAGPAVAARLAALGETRAAREAVVILASREHPALRQIDPAQIDPEMRYLLWRNADETRRAAILDMVPPDNPQRVLMGEGRDDALLTAWLASDPAAAPIGSLCAALCPETMESCLTGAYGALASHNALLTLGSPVEALIAQADFLDTPRGRATVLRRILQSTDARGRRTMITGLRSHDACLADVLNEENARYRYRRPGTEIETGNGNGN